MSAPLLNASQVEVISRAALREWLTVNYQRSEGVWLVTYKKSEGSLYLSVPEIVQECLCFGWVDSLVRKLDARRTMLYISPRKPGSNWSRVNKDHVAFLEKSGLMTEAGQAVVARAKSDGTWSALDEVENIVLPPDLAGALAAAPGALENWDAFPRSVRRGALEILLNAKRPQTRLRKINEIVECAVRNARPFQWR